MGKGDKKKDKMDTLIDELFGSESEHDKDVLVVSKLTEKQLIDLTQNMDSETDGVQVKEVNGHKTVVFPGGIQLKETEEDDDFDPISLFQDDDEQIVFPPTPPTKALDTGKSLKNTSGKIAPIIKPKATHGTDKQLSNLFSPLPPKPAAQEPKTNKRKRKDISELDPTKPVPDIYWNPPKPKKKKKKLNNGYESDEAAEEEVAAEPAVIYTVKKQVEKPENEADIEVINWILLRYWLESKTLNEFHKKLKNCPSKYSDYFDPDIIHRMEGWKNQKTTDGMDAEIELVEGVEKVQKDYPNYLSMPKLKDIFRRWTSNPAMVESRVSLEKLKRDFKNLVEWKKKHGDFANTYYAFRNFKKDEMLRLQPPPEGFDQKQIDEGLDMYLDDAGYNKFA